MKNLAILSIIFIFILGGCTSKDIDYENITFSKDDQGNFQIENSDQKEKYINLENDLNKLGDDFSKDTRVCAVSTSSANILYSLGMNLVAVPTSKNLDQDIQEKITSKDILTIGSSVEPNMEILLNADCEIVFMSDSMPMQKEYTLIDNLVLLPQSYYEDFYITLEVLINEFNLDDKKQIFNDYVTKDILAKDIKKNNKKEVTALALEYAYDNLKIATDDSYIGSLLKELNITNIYGDTTSSDFALSKENILIQNPEYIIIYTKDQDAYDFLQDNLKNLDEEYLELEAYKNKNIYFFYSNSLNVDINTPDTLLELSKNIYGE